MQITRDSQGENHVQHYSAGKITIQNTDYKNNIIVSANAIHSWSVQSIDQLKPEELTIIIEQQPEVVIVGTGLEQHFLKPELLHTFASHHIGVECMTTAAACRTFNVLLAEGRQVVCALIINNK